MTNDPDNLLLVELRDALEPPPLPTSLRDNCVDLLTWRTIDTELADLLESSALAGVRSDGDATLRFSTPTNDVTIEVSMGERHGLVVGQVSPAEDGTVTLETWSARHAAKLDRRGTFTLATKVAGAFRFRVELPGRLPIITSWQFVR
jgi:hypothetical protein